MKKFPGKYFDKFIVSTIAVSMLCISMPQQMMAENYYIQSDKIRDGLDEESTQQAQEFVQGVQQLLTDGENTGVNVIVKSTEILNDDSATDALLTADIMICMFFSMKIKRRLMQHWKVLKIQMV